MEYYTLTPSEISRVKFSISFRGYNTREVDEFLEQIEREYTKLWKENIELKNLVEFLRKELESYKKMENIINESVITSKKLADDIKRQAQTEADYIISKALKESVEIKSSYQKKITSLLQEINKIKELKNNLIIEMKNYLRLIIDKLDYMEKNSSNENDLFNPLLLSLNRVDMSLQASENKQDGNDKNLIKGGK